jgi:alkylhydroperoxidase family enzyme
MSHARSEYEDFKALAPDAFDVVLALSRQTQPLVVWREAPQFSPRERAALAWTEALTLLTAGVSDEVYAQATAEFSEQELAYLTSAVASINVWSRLGVAYRWTPPARQKAAAS